jgi:methionyl aminopeptidase
MTRANEFVVLKDNDWLVRQRYAGKCVAKILASCKTLIEIEKQPNLSLIDLENNALSIMKDLGCSATFKGYKGFPSSICTSVNQNMVHGIVTDYVLQDGDVISVDLGATYEGAIGDAASTYIYGQPKSKEVVRMIETCKKALIVGIEAVKIGNKIGAIGYAINSLTKNSGFGLITNYGGHGINYNTPHAQPFISNKSDKNEGIRITPGLTIAIEPMLTIGGTKTNILDDGWTIEVPGIACHEEHSIFIHDTHVEILTA